MNLLVALLFSLIVRHPSPATCDPFYRADLPGFEPIGAEVAFDDGTGQTLTGNIVGYYILSCWPLYPVFGLEEHAYVIDYTGQVGRGVILNRNRFDVLSP